MWCCGTVSAWIAPGSRQPRCCPRSTEPFTTSALWGTGMSAGASPPWGQTGPMGGGLCPGQEGTGTLGAAVPNRATAAVG